ncbi:hypothetical protein [Caulobacter sp. 17J80-11]|uniref:hypothetical protein n=1 Tax=Caulobacter sp. 17J80-11 TaxID=2763502 RepID=UPI00165376B4|nr:hypothetical protein [Caulobacter sp. 17J80-11]MBC6981994.1 hypothetical protein [Caulobacter sp. 17J80-11]
MATDLNQPRVFKASRLSGFSLLFWLMMVAVWRFRGETGWDPRTDWVHAVEAGAWAAAGACCLVVGFVDALFPARLTYGPQGLSWTRLGKRTRLAWSEVRAFKVVRQSVGFDYADARRPGRLPGGLKISAHELVTQLNQARARWAPVIAAAGLPSAGEPRYGGPHAEVDLLDRSEVRNLQGQPRSQRSAGARAAREGR